MNRFPTNSLSSVNTSNKWLNNLIECHDPYYVQSCHSYPHGIIKPYYLQRIFEASTIQAPKASSSTKYCHLCSALQFCYILLPAQSCFKIWLESNYNKQHLFIKKILKDNILPSTKMHNYHFHKKDCLILISKCINLADI